MNDLLIHETAEACRRCCVYVAVRTSRFNLVGRWRARRAMTAWLATYAERIISVRQFIEQERAKCPA